MSQRSGAGSIRTRSTPPAQTLTTTLLTADDLEVDGTTLVVDETNDRIGIGLAAPKTKLTVEGSITLKEQADADADTAAYGQLWVNTATPNELYFTTDAGDDIQLTSGAAAAFVGDITGITAGTGLSGGGTSGAVTLNVEAAQTQITSVGTIGTGTWQGTAVASAYLDADTAHLSGAQTFTGTKTLNSFKGTGAATVTNILDEDAMGTNSDTALATQQSIKAYADTKSPVAGHSSIATVGTIGTGTWQGTAVASAYLDADTAHLTTTQTFTGAKSFTGGVTVDADVTATTNHATVGASIDYDATGIIASGQSGLNTGLNIDVNSDAPTMVGTVLNKGIDIDLVGGTSGAQTNIGLDISATGADTNYGAMITGTTADIVVGAASTDATTIIARTHTSGTDAGKNLTVSAGGGVQGGSSNINGGNLILASGGGDGTGTSSMQFATKVSGTDSSAERMRVGTNGNVVIGGTTAHAASLTLDSAVAALSMKEMSNAPTDTAAYGQLWVKTATPNQLYFTTDAGNDIPITSGTAIAAGGSDNNDMDLILHTQVFS